MRTFGNVTVARVTNWQDWQEQFMGPRPNYWSWVEGTGITGQGDTEEEALASLANNLYAGLKANHAKEEEP